MDQDGGNGQGNGRGNGQDTNQDTDQGTDQGNGSGTEEDGATTPTESALPGNTPTATVPADPADPQADNAPGQQLPPEAGPGA